MFENNHKDIDDLYAIVEIKLKTCTSDMKKQIYLYVLNEALEYYVISCNEVLNDFPNKNSFQYESVENDIQNEILSKTKKIESINELYKYNYLPDLIRKYGGHYNNFSEEKKQAVINTLYIEYNKFKLLSDSVDFELSLKEKQEINLTNKLKSKIFDDRQGLYFQQIKYIFSGDYYEQIHR